MKLSPDIDIDRRNKEDVPTFILLEELQAKISERRDGLETLSSAVDRGHFDGARFQRAIEEIQQESKKLTELPPSLVVVTEIIKENERKAIHAEPDLLIPVSQPSDILPAEPELIWKKSDEMIPTADSDNSDHHAETDSTSIPMYINGSISLPPRQSSSLRKLKESLTRFVASFKQRFSRFLNSWLNRNTNS
jgi:hypothetical protein